MNNKSEELCINKVVKSYPSLNLILQSAILKLHREMHFTVNFPIFIFLDAYFTIHKLFGIEQQSITWQVYIVRIRILTNGSAV